MVTSINYVPDPSLISDNEDVPAQAQALSNNDLFEEYSEMLQGDDWDGCFTPGGSVVMKALETELRERLLKAGFLNEV